MKTVVFAIAIVLFACIAAASADESVAASPVLGKVLAKLKARRGLGGGNGHDHDDCDDENGVGAGDDCDDDHDKPCKPKCDAPAEPAPCKPEPCNENPPAAPPCKEDPPATPCPEPPKCDDPPAGPPHHCGSNCGCHCQNGGGCVRARFNEGKFEKEPCKSDDDDGDTGAGGKPAKCATDSDSSAEGFPWKAGQSVKVGDIRTYADQRWLARQAHTTQANWQPPIVPALWRLAGAPKPGEQWQIARWYCVGETAVSRGCTYVCLQQHMATRGWAPPYTPALWELKGKCNRPAADDDLNW